MHDQDNRRSTYDGLLTKSRDPLEFKADAEHGILTGHTTKWWVVDSYAETTAPGSFAQTIAQRGPASGKNRILLRYEHEHTIGTHQTLTEDPLGVAIEAKVSDDGQWGSAVRAHLADGVPYGLSIGFRRISDRSATDDDPLDFSSAPEWVMRMPRNEIRVLTGVKLMENSVVSFPAVDPALIDGYRTEPEDFAALFEALKSRKLTPDELAQLKQFIDAMPADASAGGSETLPTTTVQTAQRRNYAAEFELLTGVKL
jgi:HK97 family phage prohead protease